MQQSAGISKVRRFVSLARAALALPLSHPTPSQANAVTLRKSPVMHAAEGVTFIVPLVSKEHVQDWPMVCERLKATLQSFLAQTNPNWKAIIVGQDKPATLPDDPRIHFEPFTVPVEGNDKWIKLKAGCDAMAELSWTSGYAMSFDADDFAHVDLVDAALKEQASGYLITEGYLYDLSTKNLAKTGRQSLLRPYQKPFWKLCGSCALFRYDLSNGASEVAFLQETLQHEHRMFPYLAKLAQRKLHPLPFPAALYLINHGDNFSDRRGRGGFKTRLVEKAAIKDADTKRRVLQAFTMCE